MTVFEKLQSVTETARNQQELPEFLAERIFRIIDNQDQFHARDAEIDNLAEKVANYDTYGQTGYIGMGVSNLILEKAQQRLEARRVAVAAP